MPIITINISQGTYMTIYPIPINNAIPKITLPIPSNPDASPLHNAIKAKIINSIIPTIANHLLFIKTYSYHVLPHLLHLCVLPILLLASLNTPTDTALLSVLIFEILVLPQVGHLGIVFCNSVLLIVC